eukprot:COSAG02_NODE_1473_length_12429_cov_3.759448_5_plen_95_part_00
MLRRDQPADHSLPPAEVKLYAMDMTRAIHDWAHLDDICAIVEAKAKVPGLLLNKERLREAVCDELDDLHTCSPSTANRLKKFCLRPRPVHVHLG